MNAPSAKVWRRALGDWTATRPVEKGGDGLFRIDLEPRRRRAVKLLALALLVGGVFVFDTVTGYEIAGAVFYIAAMLLAVGLLSRRGVVMLAAGCVVLALVSFTLSRFGEHDAGIVNLVISVSALVIATFLALRIVVAEDAAHEAQERLVRVSRMTSFGALTASIAHEVNQPLTGVVSSGDAALRWLAQSPPRLDKAEAALQRIVEDANRASAIVTNLRRLARGDPPQRTLIDLNRLVQDVLDLAQGELERNSVEVRLALSPDDARAWADPLQIQQVLGNLILNALEAMADAPGERAIDITSDADADEVSVTVSDTGHGLPHVSSDALFGAFWTTKAGGLGMGLTISQSIIDAHGGALAASPNQPRGARFTFRLPRYAEGQQ